MVLKFELAPLEVVLVLKSAPLELAVFGLQSEFSELVVLTLGLRSLIWGEETLVVRVKVVLVVDGVFVVHIYLQI